MFNFLEDVDLKKEKEKKRKKIYGEELRLQIEQNKRRKMEEKIKSRQESIRNLQLFKNNSSNNYNNTLFNNRTIEDNYFNNYNGHYQPLKTTLDEPLYNNNLNDNYLSLSNKKNIYNDYTYNNINNYHNNTLFNNSIKKNLNNFYKSTDFNINEKKNNNFNNILNYHNNRNNIINDTKMNRQNSLVENGIFIMKKSPSSFLNINNNYNNLFSKNDDDFNNTINNNNYRYKSNIINDNKGNYYSSNVNNNTLMAEINLQFLFREFVEQQIKTINNYESNIEDIFYLQYKNSNNTEPIGTLLEREKNIAIQSIRDEQNKLKNKLGFFPMENNYNFKIEQLFNKILNKKLATYASIKEIGNLALNNLYNKQKEDNDGFQLLRYKSKYEEEEDIQDSVPNFNNLDASSQNTLRGYSKLVKIKNDNNSKDNKHDNNKEQKEETNFLESWREQLGKDIGENKKDSIKLRKSDNNIKLSDDDWEKNENDNLKINNNNYIGGPNRNRIISNIETFPANQMFKNVQNVDIKNRRSNNIHNDIKNNRRKSTISNMYDKNKISSNSLNISGKNIINSKISDNLNLDKDNIKNNLNFNKNLFIPQKIQFIDGRKNKSAYNIFKPDIVSSNNLSTYKREYLSQKINIINIGLNPEEFEKEDKPQMHKNKISSITELNPNNLNLKALKSKNSFSFKNIDSSLIKNIEKGTFAFSNNTLKHYNHFSLNKNENKDEEKDYEKI